MNPTLMWNECQPLTYMFTTFKHLHITAGLSFTPYTLKYLVKSSEEI